MFTLLLCEDKQTGYNVHDLFDTSLGQVSDGQPKVICRYSITICLFVLWVVHVDQVQGGVDVSHGLLNRHCVAKERSYLGEKNAGYTQFASD